MKSVWVGCSTTAPRVLTNFDSIRASVENKVLFKELFKDGLACSFKIKGWGLDNIRDDGVFNPHNSNKGFVCKFLKIDDGVFWDVNHVAKVDCGTVVPDEWGENL